MERREFILKSGTLVTASVFLSKYGFANALINYDNEQDFSKRPNPDNFQQPILKAIALGIMPQVHTTPSLGNSKLSMTPKCYCMLMRTYYYQRQTRHQDKFI